MRSTRPPWWVLVVLACSASFVISTTIVVFTGPESMGLGLDRSSGQLQVSTVVPGSPTERAGLKRGDIILSVDGKTGQLALRELRLERAGRTYDIALARGDQRLDVRMLLEREGLRYWTVPEGFVGLTGVSLAWLGLVLACLVAWRRGHETTAALGAIILALWPVGNIQYEQGPPPGMLYFWLSLPVPLAMIPGLAAAGAAAATPTIGLMLFASFPRPHVRGRWIWVPIWIAPAVAFVMLALRWYLSLEPAITFSLPAVIMRTLVGVAPAYWLAMPVVLIWNYRSVTDVMARRRLRVLLVGAVLATLARLFRAVLVQIGSFEAIQSYNTSAWFLVGAMCAAAGPCALAYAILRHRMFDLPVLLRQGLRYAAARHLLLAIAPVFIVMLGADLALRSDQTIAQTFESRGWLYLALAGAAVFAHAKRQTWLDALDRRFFREHYDAQRILRGVLSDVRQASTLHEVAPRALSQISEALHPTSAALLLRRTDDDQFRVAASTGQAPPGLPAGGKLPALLRVLGKPLDISRSETGWLWQQLPVADTAWLKTAQLEWIFPVVVGADRDELLLVLGPKRSEDPYSREDQDLIESVAAGLALLHDRLSSGGAPRRSGSLGAPMVPSVPSRYVIEGELGRGGMGTVYSARDTELDRQVAIKLMRPDLVSSEEAVARFRREARAAAGFSHPNVVTIFDVGATDDGRAYIVMELLAGRTLREGLRQTGRFSPDRAVAILRGVASAVEAAHLRALIHRDLKPENVFLVESDGIDVPKVLDFGVAKLLEPRAGEETVTAVDTTPGQVLGTFAYMSPEQFQGLEPGPAWDLWALTVMAYEMLTGTYPFGSALTPGLFDPTRRRVAPVPAGIASDPGALDAFFSRALAFEAGARPSTARQLVNQLAEACATAGPSPIQTR